MECLTFEEIVALGIEGLKYHIVSMQNADFAPRIDFPKCVLPKADKAEAEGCQDPRQLFFFHSLGNMSILVAICRPLLDRSFCSWEA